MRKEKCFPWIKPETALLMLLHGRFLHGGRILCLILFHVSRQSSLGALYITTVRKANNYLSSCSVPALESDAVDSVPPAAGCASLALDVCSPLSSAAVLRSAAASSCVVMTESGAASSSVANELTGSRLNNSTSASSPACRLANRFFIIRVLPFLKSTYKRKGRAMCACPFIFSAVCI